MRKKYLLIEIEEIREEIADWPYPEFAKKGLQKKRYKEALLDMLDVIEKKVRNTHYPFL